jgi:hypothetical protein
VEDIGTARWRLKTETGFFALGLQRRFERTFYKALKELQRLQALRAALSDSGKISRGADGLAVCPEPAFPTTEPIAPADVTPQPADPTEIPHEIPIDPTLDPS